MGEPDAPPTSGRQPSIVMRWLRRSQHRHPTDIPAARVGPADGPAAAELPQFPPYLTDDSAATLDDEQRSPDETSVAAPAAAHSEKKPTHGLWTFPGLAIWRQNGLSSETLAVAPEELAAQALAKSRRRARRRRLRGECPWYGYVLVALGNIVVLFAALCVFILFPKLPEVSISGASGVLQGGNLQLSLSPIVFRMDFDLNVTVLNPNYFGADIESLDGLGYLPEQPTVEVGNASLTNLRIPGRSLVWFPLPITLQYTTAMQVSTLRTLLIQCGLQGEANRSPVTMNLVFNVTASVLGISIELNNLQTSPTFNCPIDASQYSQLDTLLALLSNGGVINTIGNVANTIGNVAQTLLPGVQPPTLPTLPSFQFNL